MNNVGSRLICGRRAPFYLGELDLPACNDADVLVDNEMGEDDFKVEFPGGEGLFLGFQDRTLGRLFVCVKR